MTNYTLFVFFSCELFQKKLTHTEHNRHTKEPLILASGVAIPLTSSN